MFACGSATSEYAPGSATTIMLKILTRPLIRCYLPGFHMVSVNRIDGTLGLLFFDLL